MTFTLTHDAWGKLVLTNADGHRHVGVEAIRAFPISEPNRWISILDANGEEVLWIDHLDTVPIEQRAILENELTKGHFLPVVQRVLSIEGTSEPTKWHVETDRGTTRFSLKNEEDVRRLMGHRVLIVDSHGIRYLIPNLKHLDTSSRRWMERYI